MMQSAILMFVYRMVAVLITPFMPVVLLWRLRKGKEDAVRWHERRGWPSVKRPDGPLIWVHAASVGELNSIMPLIARLSTKYPSVLVTTGTVTSAKVAAERLPQGVLHHYVPVDCPRYVKRFFAYWRPNFGLMVESELWPNLLYYGRKNACHFVLVNGRMSSRSFARWKKRAGGVIRALLQYFDVCLCQSERDAERFIQLGCNRTITVGNLKYDAQLPVPDEQLVKQLQLLTNKRPIIVAASTHSGEDALFLAAHKALSAIYPALLTIIIPRHPGRGIEIGQLAAKSAFYTSLRSRGDVPNGVCQIYIADTIGEMSLFYSLAHIVFMGGSFVPHGGQNPIEAAQLKKTILVGPHTQNFIEIYNILESHNGVRRVKNIEEFVLAAKSLLSSVTQMELMGQQAFDAVNSQIGAVDRTIQALEPYLLDCVVTQDYAK